MFARIRVVLAVAAIPFVGLSAVAFAAPALASTPAVVVDTTFVVDGTVAAAVPADRSEPHAVRSTEAPEQNSPVAEKSSGKVTPIIMVAGLGMLVASIFMVVRSSSSRRAHPVE